jgi:hypothetical protein
LDFARRFLTNNKYPDAKAIAQSSVIEQDVNYSVRVAAVENQRRFNSCVWPVFRYVEAGVETASKANASSSECRFEKLQLYFTPEVKRTFLGPGPNNMVGLPSAIFNSPGPSSFNDESLQYVL